MFDCFMFNDELDILEIRLNILFPYVEKFVIVESDKTHSGKIKEYNFLINKSRYEKFLSKIIYIQFSGDSVTSGMNAWGNENWQRNKILSVLENEKPKDNLLFISDIDEIPKPEKLFEAQCLCFETNNPIVLSLYHCMYFLNFASDIQYRGAYLYNPDTAKAFQKTFGCSSLPTDIRWHVSAPRTEKDFVTVTNAGWHFSTIGDIDTIKHKIASYAHLEFNNEEITSDEHLLKCISEGVPYFEKAYKFQQNEERFKKQDITFLPQYILDNLGKFGKYLC